MKIMLATGAVLIILSLIMGWLIVGKRYLGIPVLKRMFHDDVKLAKCHMEYSIMALLLFAFYLVDADIPYFFAYLMCIGAFTNPSLLLIMAIKPEINTSITAPFSLFSTCSFLITTAGFGGSSLYILLKLLAAK